MYTITANIYSIDFFGETIGEPLKSVSGTFESESEALRQFSDDFSLEYFENFKVKVVSTIPVE